MRGFHGQRDAGREYADAMHDGILRVLEMQNQPTFGYQTKKHPVTYLCPNPTCKKNSTDMFFEFVSEEARCPRCGATHPAIQKKALIHLVVSNQNGPILGDLGLRYSIACDPERAYLATPNNGETATPLREEVNCMFCLKLMNQGRVAEIHPRAWLRVDGT